MRELKLTIHKRFLRVCAHTGNLLDKCLTIYGVTLGLGEINPVGNILLSYYGLFFGAFFLWVLGVVAIERSYLDSSKTGFRVLAFFAIAFCLVSISNVIAIFTVARGLP